MGTIADSMVTVAMFRYTFLKNIANGNLTECLKNINLAIRHIWEITIATISVTSGKQPMRSNIYETGKLSNKMPPTTI